MLNNISLIVLVIFWSKLIQFGFPNSITDFYLFFIFLAMDEESLSVALGNVCHLVFMVAKLLELPLRYPMSPEGSRSTIKDFTLEKVSDKDRQWVLGTGIEN